MVIFWSHIIFLFAFLVISDSETLDALKIPMKQNFSRDSVVGNKIFMPNVFWQLTGIFKI